MSEVLKTLKMHDFKTTQPSFYDQDVSVRNQRISANCIVSKDKNNLFIEQKWSGLMWLGIVLITLYGSIFLYQAFIGNYRFLIESWIVLVSVVLFSMPWLLLGYFGKSRVYVSRSELRYKESLLPFYNFKCMLSSLASIDLERRLESDTDAGPSRIQTYDYFIVLKFNNYVTKRLLKLGEKDEATKVFNELSNFLGIPDSLNNDDSEE